MTSVLKQSCQHKIEQSILSKRIHYAEIKAHYTDLPMTQSQPSQSVSLASLRSFCTEVGLMIGSVTKKNSTFFSLPPELKEDGMRIIHSVKKSVRAAWSQQLWVSGKMH